MRERERERERDRGMLDELMYGRHNHT